MDKYSFNTFREAAQFAASFCASNRTTANVVRTDDGIWLVVPSNEYQANLQKEDEDRRLAEARQKSQDEAHRRAIEQQRAEETRLKEREEYYKELTADALQALWDNREILSIEPPELEIIRRILRERLGIKPIPPVQIRVCPQCHMVGDACTCDRSWY